MTLLSVTALSQAALAAEAVAVRTGAHADYTRLVFEWPAAVTYQVSQPSPDKVTLAFPRAASLNTAAMQTDANIKSVRQTSSGDAPLVLQIDIPAGSRIRDFSAGGKVIVDVYGKGGGAKVAAPVAAAPQKIQPPEKKPGPAKAPPAPKPDSPPVKAVSQEAKAPPPHQEEPKPAPQPAPAVLEGDDVISMTSIETAGMAAFTRGGWLWLVRDKPSVVPPQLKGPHKDDLGRFEHVKVTGGDAWRLKLPDSVSGARIYGEGGGLAWRIVLTQTPRQSDETQPVRVLAPGHDGGTILWPMRDASRVLDVADPAVGDTIRVVTVYRAGQYAGAPYRYVDMETLPSSIGLAIVPHVDDLDIKNSDKGVEIGRPGGLSLSSPDDLNRRMLQQPDKPKAEIPAPAPVPAIQPFFDFDRWQMGGLKSLSANQTILLSGLKDKEADARVQDLITLAKMNLANDRGQEALGFLTLAADELPAVADGPEFIALRGAAEALSSKNELAFSDLKSPALDQYKELDYWRAFTLAELEDWRQAAEVMPSDLGVFLHYPQPLLEKMVPRFAETALRAGDPKKALALMDALKAAKTPVMPWTKAALDYLKGQAYLQQGKFDEAKKLWTPLLTGKDDMFRVRAGLALTIQELARNEIKPEQAIDRMEGLRYAWRGDELEAQINFELGKLYLQQKQYLKAFTILRDSASMSPDADIASDIRKQMADDFKTLLMNSKEISPLDAMTLFEEFHELAPAGNEGNALVQKLSERLASTDLLGRAGDLLQGQVDYSLQGQERADVALRLAAIALLNKDPQRAFGALDKAEEFFRKAPAGADRDKKLREIILMRGRGLSQQGKTEQALQLLGKMGPAPDSSRLRADIAWQAGMWPDASDALQDLIIDENIEDGKPLTDYQADLLLNRAVALNLGGDRVELANMRERFGSRMKATPRASLFDVVTRPHSLNVMAEQQTIKDIVNEVDMFKGFLDEYKKSADQTLNATQ